MAYLNLLNSFIIDRETHINLFKLKPLERIDNLKIKLMSLAMQQAGIEREIKELQEQEKDKDRYTWEKCFTGTGCYIGSDSKIVQVGTHPTLINHKNICYSNSAAKSMLAMAQLSHIIAVANGDWVADWEMSNQNKCCIERYRSQIVFNDHWGHYRFLAFASNKISREVLAQNERLIKDYLMID